MQFAVPCVVILFSEIIFTVNIAGSFRFSRMADKIQNAENIWKAIIGNGAINVSPTAKLRYELTFASGAEAL